MCLGRVNPSCCHQISERSNNSAINIKSFFSCDFYKWGIAIVSRIYTQYKEQCARSKDAILTFLNLAK